MTYTPPIPCPHCNQSSSANEEKLKAALRRILEKATPEEGQSWYFEFTIGEDAYGQWEDLCK